MEGLVEILPDMAEIVHQKGLFYGRNDTGRSTA